MRTARRCFAAGMLAVFFLTPLILFAGEGNKQLKTFKFKSDLISQSQELKTLERNRKNTKISSRLNRYISRKTADNNLLKEISKKNTGLKRQKVRVILDTSSDIDHISDRIKSYGASVLTRRGRLTAIEVPVDKIEAMVTDIDGIKHARFPLQFFNEGEISEGVDLTEAINFHDTGFKGAGVKVAVIDSGFKGLKEAHINGDIPYSSRIYDFTGNGIEAKSYHGTACAEIVYDMAPQAELHLLKVSDEIDIFNALDYCKNNDIDIISLSLTTFGSGPGDGTGPLDEAFDEARANGILVVAGAGNFATMNIGEMSFGSHWEGPFNDSNNDNVHEFTSGGWENSHNVITAVPSWDSDGNPSTSEVSIFMRWNDWPYADVDYDIYLYDFLGELVDYSNALQTGSQPPTEQIVIDIPDSEDYPHYYSLSVEKVAGEPAGTELELYLGGTSSFVPIAPGWPIFATSSSSIGEPADAEGVLAVGAIDYMNWGTGPQEDFSSQGPTNAWAGSSARIKPDIMGPDGVTSFTYGMSSFFGTSASTPHVAGAAALILSMDPAMGSDELQTYIESYAIDMGAAGKDNIYGWGKLNMNIILGFVRNHQKVSETEGDFTGTLYDGDIFGSSVTSIGDLDGNGVPDLAVGSPGHNKWEGSHGAVWVLFLNLDGTVKSHQKISDTEGNFTGILDNGDSFGQSVVSIGDLDGNGVTDLAVGASNDDGGGTNHGSVWILFLNTDGNVESYQKISDTEGNFAGILDNYDCFGQSVASMGDLDGDGVADLAVGAYGDDDGGNFNHGAVWVLFLDTDGTVKSYQKISDTEGNFTGILENNDYFGQSVASMGDLDGDGVADLAVGAYGVDGYNAPGAVWILFLNTDGTVKSYQKISDSEGNFTGILDHGDNFGQSVTSMGDLDGDGVTDLAVGAYGDDDGGNFDHGAVWILFLNIDGTVKSYQKISDTEGNFTGILDYGDSFGQSVTSMGDLDGDGVTDLAVGANRDDGDGDQFDDYGAVWILFLNNLVTDKDGDGMSDNWEIVYGLNVDLDDSADDPDGDDYSNLMEFLGGTDPMDADTDDDGISDGDEDANHNQVLDADETHALWPDTDSDGIQDGTELGVISPVADPDGGGPLLGTDTDIFIPDADPTTITDPRDSDTDNDDISDGEEDANHNGMIDDGESDPNDPLSPADEGSEIFDEDTSTDGDSDISDEDSLPADDDSDTSDEDSPPATNNIETAVSGDGGGGGGCFIATAAFGSQIEPQVKVLREFRDNILLKSRPGKIFVDYYYKYSPPVADYIAKHNTLRALVRWSLMPLVCASWLILRLGLIGVLTSLIILSTFSFYILINREYGK